MSTFDMNKALTDWTDEERETIRLAISMVGDALKRLRERKPLDVATVGAAGHFFTEHGRRLEALASERHMRALRDKDEHDTKAWAAELAAKKAAKGD